MIYKKTSSSKMSFVPEFVKCAFFYTISNENENKYDKNYSTVSASIVLQFTGLPKKDENSESN